MKKILLILLVMFSMPLIASADMGAPVMTQYDVKVSKAEGATLITYNNKNNITVPYDTVLTVIYEYEIDGEIYGEVSYNNKGYTIKLSDTQVVSDEIDLSKMYKDNIHVYVFGEGVDLYAGPSIAYGKVENGHIEAGERITYTYHDDVWGYVEYKGKKGWIYIYNYNDNNPIYGDKIKKSIANVKAGKLYSLKELKLVSDPITKETTDITIPKNKEIEYCYVYGNMYYVNYKGKSGWFNTADNVDYAYIYKGGIYTINKVEIHKSDSFDSEVIKTISPETDVTYTKYHDASDNSSKSWYYVTYDGVSGWVSEKLKNNYPADSEMIVSNLIVYKTKQDLKIYDKKGEVATDQVIPNNVEVTVKYTYYDKGSTWYYIEDDTYQGWVSGKLEYVKMTEDEENIYEPNDPNKTTIIDIVDKDENNFFTKIPIAKYALYCVGGAIIIALVVFVSIKLINKKKEK